MAAGIKGTAQALRRRQALRAHLEHGDGAAAGVATAGIKGTAQALRHRQALWAHLEHGDGAAAGVVAAVDLIAGRVLQLALAQVAHHLRPRLEERQVILRKVQRLRAQPSAGSAHSPLPGQPTALYRVSLVDCSAAVTGSDGGASLAASLSTDCWQYKDSVWAPTAHLVSQWQQALLSASDPRIDKVNSNSSGHISVSNAVDP